MQGPVTELAAAGAALVLCAHGIRGSAGVARMHAAALRTRSRFAEVHACAHKGEPTLTATLERVRAQQIYLAPLLMAHGYTLAAILRTLADWQGRGREVLVCPPVGLHGRLAELIGERMARAAEGQGWQAEQTALLIVGHGTGRHARSSASAKAHAARIRERGRFAEVAVAFLDESPTIAEAVAGLRAPHLVAEGFFVDRGEHGEDDLPRLLAAAARDFVYTGPVGCEPAIGDLILEQVRTAAVLSRAA